MGDLHDGAWATSAVRDVWVWVGLVGRGVGGDVGSEENSQVPGGPRSTTARPGLIGHLEDMKLSPCEKKPASVTPGHPRRTRLASEGTGTVPHTECLGLGPNVKRELVIFLILLELVIPKKQLLNVCFSGSERPFSFFQDLGSPLLITNPRSTPKGR